MPVATVVVVAGGAVLVVVLGGRVVVGLDVDFLDFVAFLATVVVGGTVVGGVVVGGGELVAGEPAPLVPAPAVEPTLPRVKLTGAVWKDSTPARPAAVAEEKMMARFMTGLSWLGGSGRTTAFQNAKASVWIRSFGTPSLPIVEAT